VSFGVLGKVAAGLALLALAGTAGAITFFNHTRPATLGLASVTPRPTASAAPSDPLSLVCRRPAGARDLWVVQPGSIAGYRAREQFAELTSPHEAVARTDSVSGWLLISPDAQQIETGCVAVDVRTLQSVDELPGFNTSDRDDTARHFLNATSHPYVVFQPYPVALRLSAASTAVQHATLDGDLEISGVTKPARFALDVRVTAGQVAAAGRTTVLVDDYGVRVPEEAGGFVRVDPHITLEVSLVLVRAA
jgi:polyisoprenoid-binding protein YceI